MKNIYFYPKLNFKILNPPNPYIYNLEKALSKNYNIINKKFNKIGILDFFKYFFKTDIFFFNWIEDITLRKHGKAQLIIFIFFVYLSKLFKKKIVWILHNQYSHGALKNGWTDFMYRFLLKHSNLIITHSKAGVEFIKQSNVSYCNKTSYLIHPLQEISAIIPPAKKNYDFFIWGVITPYKGILEFLKFVKDSEEFSHFKILIVGKCVDKEYKSEINKCLTNNIIYHDEFYEFQEILDFAHSSNFTLFTYQSKSVLSSGALMDAIRMRSVIIGPNKGAFKDLSENNFILIYNNFGEIPQIYNNALPYINSFNKDMEDFCKENSWEIFADKINPVLGQMFNIPNYHQKTS